MQNLADDQSERGFCLEQSLTVLQLVDPVGEHRRLLVDDLFSLRPLIGREANNEFANLLHFGQLPHLIKGGAALAREAGGLAKGLPPRFNRLREQPLHETAQTKEGAVFLEAFAAALLDKIGRILWLDTNIPGHLVVSDRSEEHTSELQSIMRISHAVFCLHKHNTTVYSPKF